MGTLERVVKAETSKNLQHKVDDCDVDVLGAVGMSAIRNKKHLAVFRLKYLHDQEAFEESRSQFISWAKKLVINQGLEKNPVTVGSKALKYWLTDTCKKCEGLRYEVDPGSPYLSNRICKACKGLGKCPYPSNKEDKELIKALVEKADAVVEQLQKTIAGKLYDE